MKSRCLKPMTWRPLSEVIEIGNTIFDRIKDMLLKDGWKEQDCGEIYTNGQQDTNFYSSDETAVIHLSLNASPDEELIERIKGEDKDIVEKHCGKSGKFLYRGPEDRHLIVYCDACSGGEQESKPLFNQLVILDYENGRVIFSKVANKEEDEDIEEYIINQLGLSLNQCEWMAADHIEIEW